MAANETIVDTLSIENLKTVGGMASHSTGLAMENAVAHQQAMFQIRELAIGRIAKLMTEIDPAEAISILKATSGNDLAGTIAALLASLSSGQQQAKVAQTTPPPTAGDGGIPPV